jgi:hypothetical protein
MIVKLLMLCAAVSMASAADLRLVVSNVTAPAGGIAQVSVWATTPTAIGSGRCFVAFDPAFFNPITQVSAYSPNGDVYGAPGTQGTILDMNFASPSAGVGRLPDLPVFTVNIPVQAGLAPGTQTTFTLDVTPAPWNDAQGNPFTVTVIPGSVTVGGGLIPLRAIAAKQQVFPGWCRTRGGGWPGTRVGARFAERRQIHAGGVALNSSRVLDRVFQTASGLVRRQERDLCRSSICNSNALVSQAVRVRAGLSRASRIVACGRLREQRRSPS